MLKGIQQGLCLQGAYQVGETDTAGITTQSDKCHGELMMGAQSSEEGLLPHPGEARDNPQMRLYWNWVLKDE